MQEIHIIGISVQEFQEMLSATVRKELLLSPNRKEKESKYISRKAAADLLHISLVTLNKWSNKGWVKPYKIGIRVLYIKSEIEESIKEISHRKHKKGGTHD